jgi:hypothetical protein
LVFTSHKLRKELRLKDLLGGRDIVGLELNLVLVILENSEPKKSEEHSDHFIPLVLTNHFFVFLLDCFFFNREVVDLPNQSIYGFLNS